MSNNLYLKLGLSIEAMQSLRDESARHLETATDPDTITGTRYLIRQLDAALAAALEAA